jgi:HNH endonuclease
MAQVHVPHELRRLVIARAGGRCEYCLIHQDDTLLAHHVDHVVALKNGGQTQGHNLALACIDCNLRKGTDLAAFDPLTGELTPLFNPRVQAWNAHFTLQRFEIQGQTAAGRATVILLALNDPGRIVQRQSLARVGRYPPPGSAKGE